VAGDYRVSLLGNGDYQVKDLRAGRPDGVDELDHVQFLAFADGTYSVAAIALPATVTVTGTARGDVIDAGHSPVGQPLLTDRGDLILAGAGNDQVTAGSGDDTILGGSGHDTLLGGAGNDLLDGGAGRDVLTGGMGADVFRFTGLADLLPTGRADTITDFSHAEGDVIDFSALAVSCGVALLFDAAATTLSGLAGEMIAQRNLTGYRVLGDVDGDAVADFALQVNTAINLVAADIHLWGG
jgi:Ca2+-binding RTX toxin-like protein